MADLITLENASVVTAWAAILAVVGAAVCSLWNTLVQRRHNRLSVRPLVVLQINTHRFDSGVRVILTLENLGVGPAIVNKLTFNLDDNPVHECAEPAETIVNAIDTCFKGSHWQGRYKIESHGVPAIKSAILTNRAHVLATVSFLFTQPAIKNSPNPKVRASYEAQFKEVTRNIDRFDVFLDYESLHGEKFHYDTLDGREKIKV